jgi:RimJ/RimL family protein N-acetyltransferase
VGATPARLRLVGGDVGVCGRSGPGSGSGSQAPYAALVAILTAPGYRQAMAGITLPNAASIGLHEGAGFAPVGVYRFAGWTVGAWRFRASLNATWALESPGITEMAAFVSPRRSTVVL